MNGHWDQNEHWDKSDKNEEDRASEALDRWLDDEASADPSEDLSFLRPTIAALREALPTDTADPAFRTALRARLIEPERATFAARLRRFLSGLLVFPAAGQGTRTWSRSFNLAGAAAMLLVAFTLGVFYYRQMPQAGSQPVGQAVVSDAAKRAADAQPQSDTANSSEASSAAAAAGGGDQQESKAPQALAAVATTRALKSGDQASPASVSGNGEDVPSVATEAPVESVARAPEAPPAPEQAPASDAPTQEESVTDVAPAATEVPGAASVAPAETPSAAITPIATAVAMATIVPAATAATETGSGGALVTLPPIDAVNGVAMAKTSASRGAGTTPDGTGGVESHGLNSIESLEADLGSEPLESYQIDLTYEFSASVPQVPASVPVYRLASSAPTLEEAQTVARSLGFGSDSVTATGDGGFIAQSDEADLAIAADGTLVYDVRTSGTEESGSATSDSALISATQTWLKGNGLLPGDAEATVLAAQDGSPYRLVVLRPRGVAMLGGGAGPRLEVGVDSSGSIVHLMKWWPSMQLVGNYPARTADDLKQAVSAGQGRVVFDPEVSAGSVHGKATVTAAQVGYQITYSLDGQAYLQPALVLEGSARFADASSDEAQTDRPSSSAGGTYHLRVTLPVIDGRYVASYSVKFQLEAPTPAAPASLPGLVYASPTPVDPAWVEDLGARLRLTGEPTVTTPDGQAAGGPRQFELRGSDGYVLRVIDDPTGGTAEEWTYARDETDETEETASATPSAGQTSALGQDQLLSTVSQWLAVRQLSSGLGSATLTYTDSSTATIEFRGIVDDVRLVSQTAIAMVVNVTSSGEIVSVTRFRLPQKSDDSRPVLSPAEALASIGAGKGHVKLDAHVLSRDQIQSDNARIQIFDLVYVPRFVAGAQYPVFEPYYVFRGTMEIGTGDGKQVVSFLISLPAWRQ